MIKLCIVSTVPATILQFYFKTLVYMSEHNYNITIISKDIKKKKNEYEKKMHISIPPSFHLIDVPFIRGINLINNIVCVCKLERIFKKNNFTIIQYTTPNASFCSSIASFISNTPIRVYMQWGIRYIGFKGLMRSFFKVIEKMTCLLSTSINPDGKPNMDFSFHEGLYSKKKAFVISYGSPEGLILSKYDVLKKPEWRAASRKELNISDRNIVFGFVGRITRDKGIEELLYAILFLNKTYSNINLIIRGSFDPYNNKIINPINIRLFEKAMAYNNVTLVDRVDNLPKLLSCFDVLIFPTYREGFGILTIEAQMMEIPVITTSFPGPGGAILDKQTGLIVKPKNRKELINAMKFFIENPEKIIEYGLSGRKHVKDKYDHILIRDLILKSRNQLIDKLNSKEKR